MVVLRLQSSSITVGNKNDLHRLLQVGGPCHGFFPGCRPLSVNRSHSLLNVLSNSLDVGKRGGTHTWMIDVTFLSVNTCFWTSSVPRQGDPGCCRLSSNVTTKANNKEEEEEDVVHCHIEATFKHS